ncbi:flavin-containing monooxygenase [Ruania zhangjianzhongii]|uniref:flavin-containing monooxygenase n=1 Tax=Ruania zhangjianzhongii TaxID=2603206 RepID=UPI0011CACBEC|nr:NAD(P)/FAD-dependent oxidoreductase [Ruania zhangjianzhongii]
MDTTSGTPHTQASVVIGSGPAGLATAAALLRRGVATTVLEQSDHLGAAWAGRHDSLRFNTGRRHSALPGSPFPRAWGQFPTRDQYVSYLHEYAAAHRVQVRTGVRVDRVDAERGGWLLSTGSGPVRARSVVVACGAFHTPRLPDWAMAADFPGKVLHAAAYRRPEAMAGRRVLVVGTGSTGMELAHELAGAGAQVWLSFRSPPNILMRELHGIPGDLPVPLMLHLPTRIVDKMMLTMQHRVVGDLAPYGLPAPQMGPMTRLKTRGGSGVAVVDPSVVASIRSGAVQVVPAVVGLDHDGARLADGTRLHPEVVLTATGYSPGLQPLVGHLDVLDAQGRPFERSGRAAAPGLHFVGYVPRPGITGYVAKLARRAAAEIAAHERATRTARPGWRPRAWSARSSRAHAASPE